MEKELPKLLITSLLVIASCVLCSVLEYESDNKETNNQNITYIVDEAKDVSKH